jgi:hypothetical protein
MTVRIEDFERHRSLLFSIAYRMLGSVAEAVGYVEGRPTGVVALDLAADDTPIPAERGP